VAVVLGLGACAQTERGVAPPPFGESAPRLFFPTGVALSRSQTSLYVANSSFDQRFSHGTLLEVPLAAFDAAAAAPDAGLTLAEAGGVLSAALLPRFPGRVALARSFGGLLIPSQDLNALLVVPLDPAGRIDCRPATAGANPDCSLHAVRLSDAAYQDPLPLALGSATFAGGPGSGEPGVFLSALSPRSAGLLSEATPVRIAAVPERTLAAFVAGTVAAEGVLGTTGSYEVEVGTVGVTALSLAPDGRLFAGGCLQRVTPEQVVFCSRNLGEPLERVNPVRSIFTGPLTTSVDAGRAVPVQQVALGPLLGGGDTQDLAVSTDGRWLYVATGRPASLLTVEMPESGGPATPRLVSLVPLASTPSRLLVLPRDSGGDLVAVTSTDADALSIIDPTTGLVDVQLRPVGDGPFELASRRVGDAHRLYVSLFQGCGLAEVEVPLGSPSRASVRATIRETTCD
jgi:hypothetical protein